MSKQPTRLANFEIPREQAAKPGAENGVEPDAKMAPKPAFLRRGEEIRGQVQQPAVQVAAPPAAAPTPPPAAVQVEPPAPAPVVPAAPVAPPAAAPPPAPAAMPTAARVPQPMPRPVEEPRKPLGARITLPVAERLRTYLFVTRQSQQDAVDEAIDFFLSSKGF